MTDPERAAVTEPERAAAFLDDLEAKPAALERLAAVLSGPDAWAGVPAHPRRVVLLGMGSSRYAAEVVALRLRAAGVDAVAEVASAVIGTPAAPDALVVAISATGSSIETMAAVERHVGRSRIVAITNDPTSAITRMADMVILLHAGVEGSGVACRTFQHTLLVLLALEAHLTGSGFDGPGLCRRTSDATADLLDRRSSWLPGAMEPSTGPMASTPSLRRNGGRPRCGPRSWSGKGRVGPPRAARPATGRTSICTLRRRSTIGR